MTTTDPARAAALRHVALAEEAAAQMPADVAGARPRRIDSVGVIGAGTMGAGIAMNIADAGLPVTLVERAREALDRGLGRIADLYRRQAERGRIGAQQAAERIARVRGATDYAALAHCDLVIEAVFEDMEVKRTVFGQLAVVAKADAVLASNTSYLDLDAIAQASGRPRDVVGLHYFSPANVMKLMEVVRGRDTAPDVLATALDFARRCGKVPVVAGVCNGFIGNRMLRAYNREAGLLLLEGASPMQVDAALTGFGMAMGPFAVADLSGIDIGYKARCAMPEGSYEPRAFLVHDALVERGHLGQKTGLGFYRHDAETRDREPNPLVEELIMAARAESGIAPREVADQEIVERCMLALANEGGFILSQGIAARAGDIDAVYVNGYGFPRELGGPMYFAEQCGLAFGREKIAALAQGKFGRWWQPSDFFHNAEFER